MNNDLIGQPLGSYEVHELLGAGAMGEVYAATQGSNAFAIKIMHEELAEQDLLRERFLREVSLMQALKHPHIVPIVDFGWYGKRLFLVMPYIEGATLQELMKSMRFSPRQAGMILDPLTQALSHAHLQGIVHRDLKPSNVLIARSDDHIYLADFGLGKRPGLDARLTETGFAVCTPSYMSPEAAVAEEVDTRSDIYSLGIMLYELLLNRLPFDGMDTSALMYAHLYNPVPLPSSEVPGFPVALEAVLLRCLAKERQDRYSTVNHFAADFADALDSLTDTEANRLFGATDDA
jgi:serine/threonine-protein kinase